MTSFSRVFRVMCLGTGPDSFETVTKTIFSSQLLGSGTHASRV